MAMDAHEIERLIKARIPDAEVTIRDLRVTVTTMRRPWSPSRFAASRACSSTRSSMRRSRARWAASCMRWRCRPARPSAKAKSPLAPLVGRPSMLRAA